MGGGHFKRGSERAKNVFVELKEMEVIPMYQLSTGKKRKEGA